MGPAPSKNNKVEGKKKGGEKNKNKNNKNKNKNRRVPKKILLYGTGESGKTTILRQMQVIHGGKEYLEGDHLKVTKSHIVRNLIEETQKWIRSGRSGFHVETENDSKFIQKDFNNKEFDYIMKVLDIKDNFAKSGVTKQLYKALKTFHYSSDYRDILTYKPYISIMENWQYFMEKLIFKPGYPEWGGPKWVPDVKDMMRARVRTVGVKKLTFIDDGEEYEIIDISGQRGGRDKLIRNDKHFTFSGIVLYVVSLGEYNQDLFEAKGESRLADSLQLWGSIVSNPAFKDAWFILFLNKEDVFDEKYIRDGIPINPTFELAPGTPPPPKVEDDPNGEKGKKWIENLYWDMLMAKTNKTQQDDKRFLRVYRTNALERDSVNDAMQYALSIVKHNQAFNA